MAKRASSPTFEQEQQAASLWVVCEHAFVPVCSADVGAAVIAGLTGCTEAHEIVTLNLRPINYREAWAHHKANAYAHSCNLNEELRPATPTVSGVVSRTVHPTYPDKVMTQLEGAMRHR